MTAGLVAGVALWPRGDALRTTRAHDGPVRGLAFLPDGTLASAGADGRVRFWAADGGDRGELPTHAGAVRGLAASPDGTRLATASESGEACLWDAATRAEVAHFPASAKACECVAIGSDNATLAAGGADRLVRIGDPLAGKPRVLKGHAKHVHAAAAASAAPLYATGGGEGVAHLWDARGKELARLGAPGGHVAGLALSADGAWLAAVGGGLRVYDTRTRAEVPMAGPTGLATAVAFHPDGDRLVTAHEDGAVRLWSRSAGTCLKAFGGHRGLALAAAVAPDGRRFATGGADGAVKVWPIPE